MPIENQIENLSEEVASESIDSATINGNEFFLVKPDSKFAHPMIRAHKRAEKDLEPYSREIVEEMRDNKPFRHFMCVNFQHFVTNSSSYWNSYIRESEFPGNSVYRLKEFGIKTGERGIIDDEGLDTFYYQIAQHYVEFIESNLAEDGFGYDYNDNLSDPLIKVMSLLDSQDQIDFGRNYLGLNMEDTLVQSFITAQQISLFYEKYINFLIQDSLGVDNAIENPCFLICPNLGSGHLKGYIELDGFVFSKDDRLILIECKNSWSVTQNYLSKFLGKADLLEKVYNVKLDRYLVSTGYMHPMVSGIRDHNLGDEVQVFTNKDYKNNYESLINSILD